MCRRPFYKFLFSRVKTQTIHGPKLRQRGDSVWIPVSSVRTRFLPLFRFFIALIHGIPKWRCSTNAPAYETIKLNMESQARKKSKSID